jgi:hypothetical protein
MVIQLLRPRRREVAGALQKTLGEPIRVASFEVARTEAIAVDNVVSRERIAVPELFG